MQVFKIYEMRWATPEKDAVYLVADTDTGNEERIGTPYNEESIIWDAVKSFPVDSIQPMQVIDVEVLDPGQ